MNFGTSEAQSDRYDSDYKKISLIIVKYLGWRAEKTEDLTLWDLFKWSFYSHPAFTYLKLTLETLEQGVKCVQS